VVVARQNAFDGTVNYNVLDIDIDGTVESPNQLLDGNLSHRKWT